MSCKALMFTRPLTSVTMFLVSVAILQAVAAQVPIGDWRLQYPPWEADASDTRPSLTVPIIGPFTTHGCFPSRYLHMRAAFWHVNARDSTYCPGIAKLKNPFKLKFDLADTTGTAVVSVSAALAGVNAGARVIMGANGSGNSKAISTVLTVFGIPNLSWASTAPSLSNKANYPLFFRAVNSDALAMEALAHLVVTLNYAACNTLYFDSEYSQTSADYFREAATGLDLKVIGYKLPNSGQGGAPVSDAVKPLLRDALQAIKNSNIWIVVALSNNVEALDTWKMAYEMNMVRRGWVWLSGDGVATGNSLVGDIANVKYFAGTVAVKGNSKGPQHPAFQAAWERLMPATERPEFEEHLLCGVDKTVCDGRTDFTFTKGRHDVELVCGDYGPFGYDAVVLLALAIDKILDTKSMEDVTSADIVSAMRDFDTPEKGFDCLSGNLVLDKNQERVLEMSYVQVQLGSLVIPLIGTWDATGSKFLDGGVHVIWPFSSANGEQAQAGAYPFPSGRPEPCQTAGEVYVAAAEACQACPPGTAALPGASECAPCPVGTFGATPGLAACARCRAGYVTTDVGGTSCSPCPAGTYADSSGGVCNVCTAGQFALEASTGCSNCGSGFYAEQPKSATCSKCPVGFTTEFHGSTTADACACPVNTVFIADLDPKGPGECFTCTKGNAASGIPAFADGLICYGGRACEGIVDHTVIKHMPCPGHQHCMAPDNCASQCVVPVQHAREVCESFSFVDSCDSWAVHAAAPLHSAWLGGDSSNSSARAGWQNVAILGSADRGMEAPPGSPAVGWVLYMRREFCAPLPVTDPAAWVANSSRLRLKSYPQPLLARAGYYLATAHTATAAGLAVEQTTHAIAVGVPPTTTVLQRSPFSFPWKLASLSTAHASDSPPHRVPLFKCAACSGGHPGQCYPGQTAFNCARCVENFYSSDGGCLPCGDGGGTAIIPFVVCLAAAAVLFLLYHMTQSPMASRLSAKLTTCLAMGLTFNGLQTLGVLSLVNVKFEEPFRSLATALQILLFDVDQLQWECVVPVSPVGYLMVRLAIPIVCVALYIGLYVATKLIHYANPRLLKPFEWPHTCNCIGMVLQVLFISICMSVILPFKCTSHPVGGGISTLVELPYQICGVGDHETMVALGIVFVMLYPVLGMAACLYAIIILPRKTASDPRFLLYFKFLVSRFRFDRYYFGIVFMLRNLLIAIVPALNPNNPMLQTVAMATILASALVVQAVLWPWAAQEVNLLDTLCLFVMLVTVVLTAGMVDPQTIKVDQLTLGAFGLVLTAFAAMGLAVLHQVWNIVLEMGRSKGYFQWTDRFTRHPTADERSKDAAASLKQVATVFGGMGIKNIEAFMDSLPDYDQKRMRATLTVMLGGLHHGLAGDSSPLSQSRRITVTRFKPRESLQMDAEELDTATKCIERGGSIGTTRWGEDQAFEQEEELCGV